MTIATADAAQAPLDAASRTTPERTLVDVFRASVGAYPDAVALEDAQGGISYRRLSRLVEERAALLAREGVRRGDRVGIRISSGATVRPLPSMW